MNANLHNWLCYKVSPQWKNQAMLIRSKRDHVYRNTFIEFTTDMRWVGDLGEIAVNHWMKNQGLNGFKWHQDNAAGKPDFTVGEVRIDVKTVKRKGPPKPSYTAQITASHKNHPIDELFFCSYEIAKDVLWLLGGISMTEFFRFAKYYGEGESVHEQYKIRKGHEIYNAPLDILEPPAKWINIFKL